MPINKVTKGQELGLGWTVLVYRIVRASCHREAHGSTGLHRSVPDSAGLGGLVGPRVWKR